MYEGGLRVPLAARWPGHIGPDSHTDGRWLSMDLFPTILQACGIEPPKDIDGVSFLDALIGQTMKPLERDLYFVRREGGLAYGGKTIEAFRRGDWKLVQNSPFGPAELYNLTDDPRETKNLAMSNRPMLEQLSTALREQIQRGGEVPWQKANTEAGLGSPINP
jgi:arylsulfatase A-like enzyme